MFSTFRRREDLFEGVLIQSALPHPSLTDDREALGRVGASLIGANAYSFADDELLLLF